MNKTLYVYGLVGLLCFVFAGHVCARVVNRTVVLVNGEPILESELNKNITSLLELRKQMSPNTQISDEEILKQRKDILEQMIDDKLMLQEAKRLKIKMVQRELEKGIAQIKVRFKRDGNGNILSEKEAEKAFRRELKKEGITKKKFEERIRDQVRVINLIDQEVKAKIPQPPEKETETLFDKVKKIINGKKIKGLEEDEKKDLESLAKYFKDSIAERIRCRHILIRVESNAGFKDKNIARRKIRDIQKKLEEGADFAQLAREYSDDTESARNGGELGFFVRGWMVPEFEEAAFGLRVGEVSDIVETEFGYHLIRCEEKKTKADLSLELVHDELAAYIYQQKAKVKFEEWIKDLRASANIQIKDETLK